LHTTELEFERLRGFGEPEDFLARDGANESAVSVQGDLMLVSQQYQNEQYGNDAVADAVRPLS
jgi:hypothetical protein